MAEDQMGLEWQVSCTICLSSGIWHVELYIILLYIQLIFSAFRTCGRPKRVQSLSVFLDVPFRTVVLRAFRSLWPNLGVQLTAIRSVLRR